MLALTGLSLPRGVLGPETWALARALSATSPARATRPSWPAPRPRPTGRSCAGRWRPPCCAAATRGGARGPGGVRDRPGVGGRRRPRHPARPRARGARRHRAGGGRRPVARERCARRRRPSPRAAPAAAVAASTAAGAIAADLLDLDPEDFAPEIADYVDARRAAPRTSTPLARATGDPEIRAWARSRRRLGHRGRRGARAPPRASAYLASGPPPADPAEDLVWVPTILALVAGGRSSARWPTRPPAIRPRARRRFGRSSASRKPQRSMLR